MLKLHRLVSLLLLLAASQPAFSQSPSQLAEEESVRRQEKQILLGKTIEAAKAASAAKDFAGSAKLYEDAWTLSDQLGAAAEAERAQVRTGLGGARLELAKAAAKRGDYREAQTQIARALKVDPTNAAAKSFKAENDKEMANLVGKMPSEEALSHVPAAKAQELKAATLAQDGKLLYEAGKLDDAEKILKQAKELSPENRTANYYLELIQQARFGRSAQTKKLTKREMLLEVEQAWSMPTNNLPDANPFARTNLIHTGIGRQSIQHKLDRIVLNEVKFDGVPLSEVVKYLDEQARLRDPEKKGINFIINSANTEAPPPPTAPQLDPTTGAPVSQASEEPVDLNSVIIRLSPGLRNVRLADAIDAIARVAEKPLRFSVEDYAIVFTDRKSVV